MKLIVGLGNPDKQYEYTYHNVGFMAIDNLADRLDVTFSKTECKAKVAEARIGGEKLILAKPQTYMNLSGESVALFKNKYKLDSKDIYVLCDDIDLPFAKVRYRENGSAGTHNGLRNIVQHIGTDFKRLKFGIGRDERFANLADFVLSKIPSEKLIALDEVIDEAIKDLLQKFGE